MAKSANSHHDRLVAEAQAGLAELTATLEKKIEALKGLTDGRSPEEQERLNAKARGIEVGLSIVQSSESSIVAYWAMIEASPSLPEEERLGLDIAMQDALYGSRIVVE